MRLAETKCALKKAEFPFQFKALCQQKAYKFLHARDGLLRWFFPRNTRFFYDLCSSSPSSKEFVLSLNKLFQLPGDEMWWMINVVHPMNFHIGMVYATHFSGMLKGQMGSLAGIIPAEHKCQGQSWCEYGFIMIYLSTYLIVYLCGDLSNCLFIYPIIYLSTCLPT
jgi:hypothetical protein